MTRNNGGQPRVGAGRAVSAVHTLSSSLAFGAKPLDLDPHGENH
jgi:hypothetical protein